MHGRLPLNLMIVAGLLAAMPAWADRDDVEEARRRVDRAERRLAWAQRDADATERRLYEAEDQYHAAAQALAAIQALDAQLQGEYVDAEQRLPMLVNDLEATRAALAAQNDVLAQAQADALAAADHAQAVRAALVHAFETSETYSATLARIGAAESAHAAAQDQARDWLADDEVDQYLRDRVEELDEQLKRLRIERPADHASIAALSRRRLDAQNELARYETEAVATLPQVQAAWRALMDNRQSVRLQRAQFERDLQNNADLLAAEAQRDAVQEQVAVLSGHVQNLNGQLANLESEQHRLAALVSTFPSRIADVRNQGALHASAANQWGDELDLRRRQLDSARWTLRQARDDYNDAARDLRDAVEDHDRHERDRDREAREARDREQREHADRQRVERERENRESPDRRDDDRRVREEPRRSSGDDDDAARRREEEERKAAERRRQEEQRRQQEQDDTRSAPRGGRSGDAEDSGRATEPPREDRGGRYQRSGRR